MGAQALMQSSASRIHIPYLEKGEWVTGLFSRIIAMNGMSRRRQVVEDAIRDEACKRGHQTPDLIRQVAMILGIPIVELFRSHTLAPLAWHLAGTAWETRIKSVALEAELKMLKGHRLCPTCAVREARTGYSTWKVHHQIIGVDRCWDCGDSLWIAPLIASICMPHMSIQKYTLTQVPSIEVRQEIRDRHRQVITMTMDTFAPVSYPSVQLALEACARKHGLLRVGEIERRNTLVSLCGSYLSLFGVRHGFEQCWERTYANHYRTWALFALAMGLSHDAPTAVQLLRGLDKFGNPNSVMPVVHE